MTDQGQVGAIGRLGGVDIIRGIASVAVCWFHLTRNFDAGSGIQASGSYGWLGVTSFFVVSGFVIPLAMHRGGYDLRKNWGTFIAKRILRIDPPYLAAVVLALVVAYASAAAPGFRGSQPHFSWAQILLHLGYLNGLAGYPWLNIVFWTLAIEFQYYLLISLLFGSLSGQSWLWRLGIGLLFVTMPFYFQGRLYVFEFLGLFMTGIAIFQYRIGVIGRVGAAVTLAVSGLSIFLTMGLAPAVVALVTALIILIGWDFGRPRPLIFLGTVSYGLYLVHMPIGGRVLNLGRRYVDSPVGDWMVAIVALAASVACATLFWYWIERPALRLAQRIRYRPRASQAHGELPRSQDPDSGLHLQ